MSKAKFIGAIGVPFASFQKKLYTLKYSSSEYYVSGWNFLSNFSALL